MHSDRKILLAATLPSSLPALQELYGDGFILKSVTRLEEATLALDEVDAVLCNIHFDEGALFDLLRLAKAHKRARSVPFFVIDSSAIPATPAITQSIGIASKALGAEEVIHLTRMVSELGERAACLKVLQLVRDRLGSDE